MGQIQDMGAEAVIERTEFLGHPAVKKIRPPKTYRHPDLDRRLRFARTKNEVRLIKDARNAGVRTPVIYDVDLAECSITMEYIEGEKIKDIIDRDPNGSAEVCKKIGESLAKMHSAKICHGDLTTSNMILNGDGELCIFDFSLGSFRADIEGIGVDIHLLERAFASAHSKSESAFSTIVDSYCRHMPDSKAVMKRVEDIKERARYT